MEPRALGLSCASVRSKMHRALTAVPAPPEPSVRVQRFQSLARGLSTLQSSGTRLSQQRASLTVSTPEPP